MECQYLKEDDVIIAVIGPTGTGKTTFLNAAMGFSGEEAPVTLSVGNSLRSSTEEVILVPYRHPASGRRFVFVDTPGFDDTQYSDIDTLKKIARFQRKIYHRKIHLSSILYFCRISDSQIFANPLQNGRMFENLFGKSALSSVVLVTTMWDEISETEGNVREQQLRDVYWKSMLSSHARMIRFEKTQESAWKILETFTAPPQSVHLAIELEKEGKQLWQTRAGAVITDCFSGILVGLRELIQRIQRSQGSTQNGSTTWNSNGKRAPESDAEPAGKSSGHEERLFYEFQAQWRRKQLAFWVNIAALCLIFLSEKVAENFVTRVFAQMTLFCALMSWSHATLFYLWVRNVESASGTDAMPTSSATAYPPLARTDRDEVKYQFAFLCDLWERSGVVFLISTYCLSIVCFRGVDISLSAAWVVIMRSTTLVVVLLGLASLGSLLISWPGCGPVKPPIRGAAGRSW